MAGRADIFRKQLQSFRDLIAAAEADGAERDGLLLRLTRGDITQLKRDETVAPDEIRFKDGEMRFLGVRVTEGGVAVSTLDRAAAE